MRELRLPKKQLAKKNMAKPPGKTLLKRFLKTCLLIFINHSGVLIFQAYTKFLM